MIYFESVSNMGGGPAETNQLSAGAIASKALPLYTPPKKRDQCVAFSSEGNL